MPPAYSRPLRILHLLVLPALLAGLAFPAEPVTRAEEPAAEEHRMYLPLVRATPIGPSAFGFDLRDYADDRVLGYASEARPRWVRAGDVLWAHVEPVRGQYNWDALARLENNVRRVRAMGFEPTVVVQWTPAWAQSVPGRLCSPPRREHWGDFVRFMAALAARYRSGDAAIHYWEVWNEPDVLPEQIDDLAGVGCWANLRDDFFGGDEYGEVLRQVVPAIKAANPNATVLGGALLYWWPDDSLSRIFLHGMLRSGGVHAIDTLSFHAYGEWGSNDLLVSKTTRIRSILGEYGLRNKPLFATEIAAQCPASGCPPDFTLRQANFAARIYAIAMSLDLYGALWFSLVASGPAIINNGQLIDDDGATLAPRPAFFAFRNSAVLLGNAEYIGPPLSDAPIEEIDKPQVLVFRKGRNILYVLWVPRTDFPVPFNLPVPPGTTAICTDQLNLPTPATYLCSDTNGDGVIPRAVAELPQYVELVLP